MKILILGAGGMAGHTISLYFVERGHDVTGFDLRKSPYCTRSVVGNATDTDLVTSLVREGRFDAVINCIGLLNQFAENNKALAAFLNAYFPHFLADITVGLDTRVIHMSTDCVFSGERGGYVEDALRDGRTFYDRSKALGELEDDKNVTLRNSIVGPDINSEGIGLLNWFMRQKGEIFGYTKAIWTGQTTLQLAKTMEAAILAGATGLYNAVPESSVTKYELLCLFNRYLRGGAVTIRPSDAVAADKSLVRTRFDFDYRIPDYETMVEELAVWVRAHADLYPHYSL